MSGDRHPGEAPIEYLVRRVEALDEKFSEYVLDEAERRGREGVKDTQIEGSIRVLEGRVSELEDGAEVTGIHNAEELKGKYYDTRRELESERALRNKVLLSVGSFALATLGSIIAKKLGWM